MFKKKNTRCSISLIMGLITIITFQGVASDRSSSAPEISMFGLNPNLLGSVSNSVNLFTGDLNLPLNLVTMPGHNGLDVNVSILYNSNVKHLVDTWNLEAPTSVLGLGWSMDFEKIVVDHKETGSRYDDDFYLISGGSSNLLVRTGGPDGDGALLYRPKNYQFWEVRYFSTGEYWEIIKEDGTTFVYGDSSAHRNTVQWGIKWDNWIGNSSGITNQEQFAITWNLCEISNQWDDKVIFEYDNVDQYVGSTSGEKHTEASYLKRITDVYGRMIEFKYEDKYDDEYMEPHTEVSYSQTYKSHEIDGYQERFEKKYLDNFEVQDADTNKMYSVHFEYDTTSADSLTKRYLTTIKQKNADGDSLPSMKLEYRTTDPNEGALEKITFPQGGYTVFTYEEKTLTLTDRNKTISKPSAIYEEPWAWVADDYVVIAWYDYDNDQLYVTPYVWDGRWIAGTSRTISNVPDHNDNPNIEVFLEKDFFILIREYYSGEATRDVHAWHRNPNKAGKWYYETRSSLDMGPSTNEDEVEVALGDDYFVLVTPTYGYMHRFRWDGDSWVYNFNTPTSLTNSDVRFFIAGDNNYFILHDENDNNVYPFDNSDIIQYYYLNELGSWCIETLTGAEGFNTTYVNDAWWYCNNNSAVVFREATTELIYRWDEDFSAYYKTDFGSLNDASKVFFAGNLITIDDVGTNSKLLRYDGNTWQTSTLGAEDIVGASYDISIDCQNIVNNPVTRTIYNPNTSTYSNSSSTYNVGYSPTASKDFYLIYPIQQNNYKTKIYVRRTSGVWTETDTDANHWVSWAGAGEKYFLMHKELSHNPTTKIGYVKNGHYDGDVESLNGQGFHDWYTYGEKFVGRNIFVTYNNMHMNHDASQSDTVRLYVVLHEDYTGKIKHFPVVKTEIHSGYDTTYVSFVYDTTKAAFDPAGNVAQYNKVTVYPGSSNGTDKPFGYTEHYYFNGLSRSDLVVDFAANGTYTNADDYYSTLKGTEYLSKVYNSSNSLIDSAGTYWKIHTKTLGSKDVGTYARFMKTEARHDGILTTTTFTYDSDNGLVNEVTETNTDGTVRKTKTAYAFDQYSSMEDLNMLSQVAQKTVYVTSVSAANARSSSVTTWKDWGTDKWAPVKTYAWLENDTSYSLPSFNYSSWSDSTEPTEPEWIRNSKIVTLDTTAGNILETIDANDVSISTKWGYDSKLPIASIVNARTSMAWLGSECGYIGFESGSEDNKTNPDEDYWGYYSADDPSTDAHTGVYSCKLENATTPNYGPTKDFLPPDLAGQERTYVASCWIKTEPGFESNGARFVFHTKRDDDDNNSTYPDVSGAYQYTQVGDTQGEWVYVELELDVEQIRDDGSIPDGTKLRLRVFPYSMDEDDYMLVDDIRVYPKDALMTSRTFDPDTYQATSASDIHNRPVYSHYDSFHRQYAASNADGQLLSSSFFYNSREHNSDVFSSSDPNYVRSVVSQNDGSFSDYKANVAAGWTAQSGTWACSNETYQQSNTVNNNTNSYKAVDQTGLQYYSWTINFVSGSRQAGIHVMASDATQSQRGNAYLFWQNYYKVRLYESVNNTLTWRYDFYNLAVSNGGTYTYELLYDPSTGRFDFWRDGSHAGTWTDSSPVTSGSYISLRTNTSNAKFDDVIVHSGAVIETNFTDGLDRVFQGQSLDGTGDVITKTVFNDIGKAEKTYRPQRFSNSDHDYYSVSSGSYTEQTYQDDPLARPYKFYHPSNDDSVVTDYGSEHFYDATYGYRKVTDEEGNISKSYYDKFGNDACGVADENGADEIQWANVYDVLGNQTTIKPPNFFSEPGSTDSTDWVSDIEYNTLGQVVEKTTPDEGTAKFVYDANGNLRYSQDAEQRAGSEYDFTVYYYDNQNRLTLVGEETDADWNATAPSLSNDTYGKDADEWKRKFFYDADYTGADENWCQGQLTMTLINQDSDDAAEDTTKYVYDTFGNLIEKRVTINGLSEKVIRHEYDLTGKETQVEYPSGETVVREYDHLGRLKKMYMVQ